MPPPAYKVRDEVWLLQRYIYTTQPSIKLDYKHFGKFRIIQNIIKYAYKLKLLTTMKVHLVFHVSLLEPIAQESLAGPV